MNKPLVSIVCITYNHEKYIAEAIDSFLMQETDFDFEIVIGEDCSTDKTLEIVKEYKAKFPEKIHIITSNNNVGMMPNFVRTIEKCKAKYLAFCEGDDYWIDNKKLQKQVDYLEKNDDVSMVLTHRNVLNIYEKIINSNHKPEFKKTFTEEDVLRDHISQTQTVMMHNYGIELVEFIKAHPLIYGGDRQITYFASIKGDIHKLDFISSVYRQTGSGVHTKLNIEQKLYIGIESFIDLHYSLGFKVNKLLIGTILNSYKNYPKNKKIILLKNFRKTYKVYTQRYSILSISKGILYYIIKKITKS